MSRLRLLLTPALLLASAPACKQTPDVASTPPPRAPATQKVDTGPGPVECIEPDHLPHPCADVLVTLPEKHQVGTPASARVTVRPKGRYHVNKDFPIQLEVTPPPGVEMVKAQQNAADAAKLGEDEAAFDVKFTPRAAGEQSFTAAFQFALCTEKSCDPKFDNLTWHVSVQ